MFHDTLALQFLSVEKIALSPEAPIFFRKVVFPIQAGNGGIVLLQRSFLRYHPVQETEPEKFRLCSLYGETALIFA